MPPYSETSLRHMKRIYAKVMLGIPLSAAERSEYSEYRIEEARGRESTEYGIVNQMEDKE